MKITGLILLAAAFGAAAGFAIPRRKAADPVEAPAPPPPAAAPEAPAVAAERPQPANHEEELKRLEAELEALRRNPATFTPEEKKSRAAELTAGLMALEKAENQEDLVAAMHALAALGKEGYEGAFRALQALDDLTVSEGRDRLLDACDGAVLRMAMWAIGDPAHAPEGMRPLCAEILARHFDDHLDAGSLILRALASEQDEEVRALLARTLPFALPSAATPSMATSGFGTESNGEAAVALARGIALNHWPEKERERVLSWMATSSDTALADAAVVAKVALRPPVAGVLIERMEGAPKAGAPDLKPGDIVISVDGEPLLDIEDLAGALGYGDNAIFRVRRGAAEFDLGVTPGSIKARVDGTFVEPRP